MTTLSKNGGTIFVQFASANIQYSMVSSSGPWTNITSFPITIVNTGGSLSNILTVSFVSNITINNALQYFITGSSFITYDGNGNNVEFANVSNYPGFIQNFRGNSPNVNITAFHTITVQNINASSLSGSNSLTDGGWICGSYFGQNIKNTSGFNSSTNLIRVLNCNNSLDVSGSNECGGIIGSNAATNGVIYIYNCVNAGILNAGRSGGVVGSNLANTSGIANVVNCSNSGTVSASNAGGIVGVGCANGSGNVTITGCSNSGSLNGGGNGGIVSRNFSGTISISNCVNTGNIVGSPSSGILGPFPSPNATVTINNCLNTGLILTEDCGGIAGTRFGSNSNNLCAIRNSYNIGNSVQQIAPNRRCGGIVGSDCGYNTSALYTPNILIENCYNLGSIYTNGGGILGGSFDSSINIPNITLNNCYNNGGATAGSTGINLSDGLIADNFTYKSYVSVINCYNAFDNTWSDSSATAVLTGVPGSNKLGITWTSAFTNKPWVLSSFNDALYNPASASVSAPTDSYTTTQGLIQGSDIKYSIVSNVVSVSNSSVTVINDTTGVISYTSIYSPDITTYTTNVITFKGNSSTWPIYQYQINNFILNYKPPPTEITDGAGLTSFMESTGQTVGLIIDNLTITTDLIATIPKILISDGPNIQISKIEPL